MYRNMREILNTHPIVLDCLWEATLRSNVEPYWEPVRGGTDGSRLTAMGLPTPNIYTGGQNFHSRTEWLSVDFLNKTVETVVNLAQVWVEKSI
jgi:tripeptide aminopeptidase